MAFIKKRAFQLIKASLKTLKTRPSALIMALVVMVAAFVRSYDLRDQAILFGDAGRDLLVAKKAVLTGQLPLVGIPSSVPRFHQGPLTVWLQMIVYLIFGQQTLAYSIVFALISLMAVIGLYELVTIQLGSRTGLTAATLLALSPLAVAQGRIPYHTNPIPLALIIFLASQLYLWQRKKWGLFVAFLGWAFIMQFELSLFALVVVIPYIMWRRKIKLKWAHLSQLSAAFFIGFLPQVIHDLTQPIAQNQIGGFMAWVGYRFLSWLGFLNDAHQVSSQKLTQALAHFLEHGSKVFSPGYKLSFWLALLIIALATVKVWSRKIKLPPLVELTCLATAILSLSYLIHSAPSTAYFPPYLVLSPILVAYGLKILLKNHSRFLLPLLLLGYSLFNLINIHQHHFFVSNTQAFNLGPSIAEQRQILKLITQLSDGNYQLATTDAYGYFPSYFAGYRWLAQEMGLPEESPQGQVFYLEKKESGLSGYPNLIKFNLTSRDIYY